MQSNKPEDAKAFTARMVDDMTKNGAPPKANLPDTEFLAGAQPQFNLSLSDDELIRRTKRVYYAPYYKEFPTAGRLYQALAGPSMIESGDVAICGAGPGLVAEIETLREVAKPGSGVVIMSLNNAHEVLLDHGIKPDLAVLIESRVHAVDYINPIDEVGYILASQVHDDVLEKFRKNRAVARSTHIFHALTNQRQWQLVRAMNHTFHKRPIPGVTGGTSVGTRMLDFVPVFMGAGRVRFFGLDSSASGGEMHAKPKMFGDKQIKVHLQDPTGRYFKRPYHTTKAMYRQAGEFWSIINARCEEINAGARNPFELMFYGRGLLPDWAAFYGFHVNSAAIKKEIEDEGYLEDQEPVFQEPENLLTIKVEPGLFGAHDDGAEENASGAPPREGDDAGARRGESGGGPADLQ